MDKLALRLAFIAAGISFLALKLGEFFCVDTPLFYIVALCVPATALGAFCWWLTPSFARRWPVVFCGAMVVVGMTYAMDIDKNRGLVAMSYVSMTLPLAALIVKNRLWWDCARIYVYANALAIGIMLWFEYQTIGIAAFTTIRRLGFLASNDGATKLANPNIVGGQLAFAAVLALVLYLRGEGRKRRPIAEPRGRDHSKHDGPRRFSLGWTMLLSLACILTASRGAFVAWAVGVGLLLFHAARSQISSRQRDLVAVSGIACAALLFAIVATGYSPWDSLQARFEMEENVMTASGRLYLWQAAIETWLSSTRLFLIGSGTGVAPDTLGLYLGLTAPDGISPDTVDTHNAFVEWGLSYGVLGIFGGVCFLLAAWRKARQLDRRNGDIARQALLFCFCTSSLTFVTFYHLLFVASGALILASLSEAPAPGTGKGRHRTRAAMANAGGISGAIPHAAQSGRRRRQLAATAVVPAADAAADAATDAVANDVAVPNARRGEL